MLHYIVKVGVSALIIVAISEIAKRNSLWAAMLASLPLTSLLAFIWLYTETKDVNQIADLSIGIFWLVLPSLLLFVLLPVLLRAGWGFWLSLGVACLATAGGYAAMAWVLAKYNVKV
jgi:hypothetical protein